MADRAGARAGEQARGYLSPQEFSLLSGLSLATVHRYLRAGQLPFRQTAGFRSRIVIPRDALDVLAGDGPGVNSPESPTVPASSSGPQDSDIPTRPSGPRPKWTRQAGSSAAKEI